jgi:DNA-directed RNA polymerase III subunit RPC3
VILDHGKLRPPDVLSLLHVSDSKSRPPCSSPGLTTKSSPEISQYHQTLHKLVTGSYLKPSTVLSHWSPRDRLMQYEAEEKRKVTGFPTAKELRQAKEVAEARLKREEEEEEQIGLVRRCKNSFSKNLP